MKTKLVSCLFIIIFTALFVAMIMYGKKQYRYECQDPTKYQLPICQKPYCEVSGLCTEYLIKMETQPVKEVKK